MFQPTMLEQNQTNEQLTSFHSRLRISVGGADTSIIGTRRTVGVPDRCFCGIRHSGDAGRRDMMGSGASDVGSSSPRVLMGDDGPLGRAVRGSGHRIVRVVRVALRVVSPRRGRYRLTVSHTRRAGANCRMTDGGLTIQVVLCHNGRVTSHLLAGAHFLLHAR